MSIFSKIFSNGAKELVSEVGSVVDNLTTTKEEKLEAKKKLKEVLLDYEKAIQVEVSERWRVDMQSDSWLSKNTRPLALVFLTVSMMLLIFIDSTGLDFSVDSGWVDLLKSLLITVYVAYFGSRGAEKFKSISK